MKSLLQRVWRSLTGRLLLLFIVVSLCLEVLLVVTLLHGFSTQWRGNVRPHLEQYLDYVNADIGSPPDVKKAQEITERLPLNIYIDGPDTNYSSTGNALDLDDVEFRRSRRGKRSNSKGQGSNGLGGSVQFGEHSDKTILLNSVGDYKIYYELRHVGRGQDRDGIVLGALVCLFAILAACYFLLRRMLRPVQDIKQGVRLMGKGQLDYRVPVRADNDLGELAGIINTMASDIEQMLDAKRQLLLGASHELRSPLTRAKIATQLLEGSTNRDRIEEDLAEMEMLIKDILESERMKAGHAVLDRTSVRLDVLSQSVLSELQADQVALSYDENLGPLSVDETRFRLLLRNLLSNAIAYSADSPSAPELSISSSTVAQLQQLDGKPESAITQKALGRCVAKNSLKQSDSLVVISVSDSGPGIDAQYLSKVTEPFYRPDASRTRKTGGFGLGLHLAKLIAEAHGGVLLIESSTVPESSGTVVTVAFPDTKN